MAVSRVHMGKRRRSSVVKRGAHFLRYLLSADVVAQSRPALEPSGREVRALSLHMREVGLR